MSEREAIYHTLIKDGEIDHAAWLRARAESRPVGECPRCQDYLIPQRPHEHANRTDYQADCRDFERCTYSVLAPGGRVLRSALKSLRGG